ncbi:MAG: MFS transporter, partial [Burkholderiaceae bacterium]
WWVAHEGGAADLALFAAAMAAGSFVALPLLSPLGDRLPKRRLIAGGLALMALEALLLAGLAQAGIYRLGWVMALELAAVVAMAVIMPASFSIVAELLPGHQLTEGLGLQKSAQALGRLLGPALGGLVLAAAGTAAALWLHALLLLLASGLALRIKAAPPQAHAAADKHWLADLKAGLLAKWRIPLERGWTFVSFLVMIFFTPAIGMLVPLKVQSLGLSAVWLGACEAGLSLGMLLGSLGGSVWLSQRVGRFNASYGAILLEGLSMLVIGWSRQPLLIVLCFALLGGCIATVQMVGQTHRMLAMPQAFRARMTAVNMMVMQVAGVLGPGLAGLSLLHGRIDGIQGIGGVDAVYVLFGAELFLVGLGYRLVPGYREFLNLPHAQAEGRYARDYPALFR